MEVKEKTGYWRVILLLLLGCNYAIVSINHTLPTFQGYTPNYFCQVSFITSVAVMWSLESLHSNPVARVRFLAGSGILTPILELGVCALCSVLC